MTEHLALTTAPEVRVLAADLHRELTFIARLTAPISEGLPLLSTVRFSAEGGWLRLIATDRFILGWAVIREVARRGDDDDPERATWELGLSLPEVKQLLAALKPHVRDNPTLALKVVRLSDEPSTSALSLSVAALDHRVSVALPVYDPTQGYVPWRKLASVASKPQVEPTTGWTTLAFTSDILAKLTASAPGVKKASVEVTPKTSKIVAWRHTDLETERVREGIITPRGEIKPPVEFEWETLD